MAVSTIFEFPLNQLYIATYGFKHVPLMFLRVLEESGGENPLHFQKYGGHVFPGPHLLIPIFMGL